MESVKEYDCLEQNYICVSDLLHGFRVANLAMKICDKLGIQESVRKDIFIAGIFHDIGKAGIEPEILNKRGSLSEREKNRVQLHTVFGAQISWGAKFSKESVQMIYAHHEKWDGTGYPTGKKGRKIPLGARILTVCDVFDALISDRPYRKGYSKVEALNQMEREKGTLDPKVFGVLKEVID